MGASRTGTTVSAFANSQGGPAEGSVQGSASIWYEFRQKYNWNGDLPNSGSFKVEGSGTVKGSASFSGPASCSASSRASGPGFDTKGEAPPDYAKYPSGLINVAVGSNQDTTASFLFKVEASAGGGGQKPQGSYSANGSSEYNIGNIVQ